MTGCGQCEMQSTAAVRRFIRARTSSRSRKHNFHSVIEFISIYILLLECLTAWFRFILMTNTFWYILSFGSVKWPKCAWKGGFWLWVVERLIALVASRSALCAKQPRQNVGGIIEPAVTLGCVILQTDMVIDGNMIRKTSRISGCHGGTEEDTCFSHNGGHEETDTWTSN